MEHLDLNEYNYCISWARDVIENKGKYLVLDTETTGLSEKDIIIQIAVTDLDGNPVINTLVKPTNKKSISRAASEIHGIKSKDLAFAPSFADVMMDLLPHIENGKEFLIYNFDFDSRMISQTFDHEGLIRKPRISGACVMLRYSMFVGQWNPFYNDYKRQRLPGSNHDAMSDCLATISVINLMASAEYAVIPDGYKPQKATIMVKQQNNKTADGQSDVGCFTTLGWFVVVIVFFWVLIAAC